MRYQTKSPFISIIIPTWNRKNDLIECIDSIQSQDYPQDKMEVIVFDNDSNDGTEEVVSNLYIKRKIAETCRVEILKSDQNIGSSRPFNEAISRVNPKSLFVIGMDDDVVLERDCIKTLIDTTKDNPDAGVVGARAVYFEQPNKTAYGAGHINWWLAKFSSQDAFKMIECDYVIGCCFLFRKHVFIEVGGIDPDYYTSHWEMDFCTRVKWSSYKIYYQPEAVVKHKVSVTTHKRSRLYYLYRNKLMLIKKVSPFFPKLLSILLYIVFWIPKIFGESLVYHRDLNRKEMKIIFKAVMDGFFGAKGRMGG